MSQPLIQPLPIVMTTDEVAAILRCSPDTVRRYVFSHRLAAIRIGRQRRFRADDVADFIAACPVTAQCDKRRLRRKTANSAVRSRR